MRGETKIRVVCNGNEHVDSLEEVKHNIIREALRLVGIEKGIEVIYMADIPMSSAGIGLASSSALAVGVLNALHVYKGEFAAPGQLAKEACEWIAFENRKRVAGKTKLPMASAAAFIFTAYVVVKQSILRDAVPGYPLLMCVLLFGFGITFLVLRIIGQYLAQMYLEVKHRPKYIVRESSIVARAKE